MKKNIVFIDDERDILEAVQIILESQGYKVKTFAHITSIQDIIKAQPDLILLDILLVGQSGKDLCKRIRLHPLVAKVPVVMLSAHPLSKLKTITKQAGADGYLQKPFELDILVNTAKKYLGDSPQPLKYASSQS